MTEADFNIVLPEVFLAIFAMAALLFGVYGHKDKSASLIVWASAAAMAVVAIWIGANGSGTNSAFGGMFIDDAFSRFSKIGILLSGSAVLLMSEAYLARRELLRFEYPLLVVLATVGMMVMVSAGDLMALYMGLELQSLALYVVASLRRDSVKSTEAGLKYFVLGALSSGMLLYGASLVYGFSGTTLFSGIYLTASEGAYLAWPAIRPDVPDHWPCLQSIRGAVPHVDARRLRRITHTGHCLLCDRTQDRGYGAFRAPAV